MIFKKIGKLPKNLYIDFFKKIQNQDRARQGEQFGISFVWFTPSNKIENRKKPPPPNLFKWTLVVLINV